jgi:predicted transcriptional regulator of viral defense system
MDIKNKTLSRAAAQILEKYYATGVECIRLEEAYTWLPDSSPDAVRQLLAGMVRRGLLLRVKEGLYYIVPFEQPASEFMPNWHVLAHYLAGYTPYYIGYASALQLLNLNTQPVLDEQIVVARQMKPSVLLVKDVPFRFIYHNQAHFFGFAETWVNNQRRVNCSDPEKTVIDCLFKPQYARGVSEIAGAIYKSRTTIDQAKLFDYAVRFGSQSVIKRLGFLLETLQLGEEILPKLHALRTSSVATLDPSLPAEGKISSQWMLLQNIDTPSITSPIFT